MLADDGDGVGDLARPVAAGFDEAAAGLAAATVRTAAARAALRATLLIMVQFHFVLPAVA
jgi:hypothetical protein